MKLPIELSQVKTLETLALETIITHMCEACQFDWQDVADYVEKILDEIVRHPNIDEDMLFLSPVSRNQDTLLITACRTRNTAIVRNLLLRCGEHVSVTDSNEEDLLKISTETDGYTNKARLARMINTVNREGETALTLACQKSHVEIVELLLGALFDADKREALNHETKGAYTALMIASRQGDAEMVKVILDTYSSYNDRLSALNRANNSGETALMLALLWGGSGDKKASLASYADNDRFSALDHDSRSGNTTIVDISITEKRGDAETAGVILAAYNNYDRLIALNRTNNSGEAALMIPLHRGDLQCVHGYLGLSGETALMLALLWGDWQCVCVVLNAYPTYNDRLSALNHRFTWKASKREPCLLPRPIVDDTALLVAAGQGKDQIVKVILAAYDDHDSLNALNQRDRDGNTVITCAVRWGNVETVKVILAACSADDRLSIITRKNNDGDTVLMCAARWGDVETVAVILAACSASDLLSVLNQSDRDGNTVLMYAARWGCAATMKMILESYHERDRLSALNHENKEGQTASMLASRGNAETVQVILDGYSDDERLSAISHVCQAGRTALFCAVSYGHADVVRLLLQVLPSDNRVRAISHIAFDGSHSITSLCQKTLNDKYKIFENTIIALFEPLSYSEQLAILNYSESNGCAVLTPLIASACGQIKMDFVESQLTIALQQQIHPSMLMPLSIFARSVSVRPPSNEIACRLS